MVAVTGTTMSWNIYTLELEQDAALDEDSENKMSAASKTLSDILLGYDAVFLLVDVVSIVSGLWRSPGKIERFKRGYDWSACIASGAGILHLGLLVAKMRVDKEEDVEDFLPDWLMTLPEIGSALRLLKNPVVVAWGFGLLDAAAAGASIASIAVAATKD
jgi:hypothetical protein